MMTTKKNKDVSGTKPEGTAAKDAATAPQDKRTPAMTFRVEDVSCSIWGRQFVVRGEQKTFYSCTFERSYKDRDGSWKYTKSFDPDSLGKLATVIQQASEYLHTAAAKEESPQ